MSAHSLRLVRPLSRRWGLGARFAFIALVLSIETLLLSSLIQRTPADTLSGVAAIVREGQHWLFRFIIAYVASFAILTIFPGDISPEARRTVDQRIRVSWLMVHVTLLVPFAWLSVLLYGNQLNVPFVLLAVGRPACAFAVATALFAALAPLSIWWAAVRKAGALPLYALVPAAGAVLAIKGSQLMWAPTARLTFRLVLFLLRTFRPDIHANFSTLTVATDHFSVTVLDACSGLEGIGLMLIFCAAWLWYFRREFYFPRALIIVPVAVLLMFLLNAVRIGTLVLIGDAGYERIALVGFHSQAGWIAFNVAALTVAVIARRSPWFSRNTSDLQRAVSSERGASLPENPVAPFLMPLLTILATGMLAHAVSAGFDVLYPIRLVGAAAALWIYRGSYRSLDWHFSWRAMSAGALVFVIWVFAAQFLTTTHAMPDALSQMSDPSRLTWIVCRVAAATVTVPIAEELAYRGYLLRRLMNPDFASISFREIRWPALAISSIAFGLTHGSLWLPGTGAGFAYGLLATRTGKIGEAVAAHATTNVLLAAYILGFNQWQLW